MSSTGTVYKFQAFGPHTGLNLVMLCERQSLFFAAPSALNDPTDCAPSLEVDEDPSALLKALEEIQKVPAGKAIALGDPIGDARRRLARHIEGAQPDRATTGNFIADYFGLIDPVERAALEVRWFMERQIGIPRVFSASKRWNLSQMWSHYGDSHQGFCLRLSGISSSPEEIICDEVSYSSRRNVFYLEDLLHMNDKKRGQHQIRRLFFEKSQNWISEEEFRLVTRGSPTLDRQLSLPQGDFYRLPNIKLEAVYFGANCPPARRKELKDLVQSRLSDDETPEFLEVKQPADSYELTAHPAGDIPPVPPMPGGLFAAGRSLMDGGPLDSTNAIDPKTDRE